QIAPRRLDAALHLVADEALGMADDRLDALADRGVELGLALGLDAEVCDFENHRRSLVDAGVHCGPATRPSPVEVLRGSGFAGPPRGGPAGRDVQSLQPRAGSASALTATERYSLLMPLTSRRYMSCTGLPAADSVNLPRGLSTTALCNAAV